MYQSPSESTWQDGRAYHEYQAKRMKEAPMLKLRPPSVINLKSNKKGVVLLSSIRFKTMTALGILFLLMMAICLAVLVTAFVASFDLVEQSYSKEAAKRTTRAYFDDFQGLTAKLFEYGAFDDTVKAVTASNSSETERFMDYYLNCNYQQVTKLNFALLYRKNGTLMSWRACFKGISLDHLPEEFYNLNTHDLGAHLLKNIDKPSTRNIGFFSPVKDLPSLVTSPEKKKMMNLNITETELLSYIILLSGMPIQDNFYSKTHGLIVFGRFDLAEYKQDMANRVQLCITLYNLEYSRHNYLLAVALKGESTSEENSHIFKQDKTWVNTFLNEKCASWHTTSINGSNSVTKWKDNESQLNQPLYVDEINNMYPITENRYCADIEDGNGYGLRMAVFQKYYDITKNYTIVLRTDFARRVFVLGTISFISTWAVMTAMILILSFSIMVFLEIVVIRRVMNFAQAVRDITMSNNFKMRLDGIGKDELGLLTDDVNNMLETLDESQQIIVSENERIQVLLEKTSLSEQHARVIMNSISDFIFTVICKNGEIATFNSIFETRILKKNTLSVSDYLLLPDVIVEELNNDHFLGLFESLSYNINSRKEAFLLTTLGTKLPVSLSSSMVTIVKDEQMIEVFVVVARNMEEQQELMASIKQHQETIQYFEFERIMAKKNSKELFRVSFNIENFMKLSQYQQFCEGEYSAENFNFLEDVATYREIKRTAERSKKQNEIIVQYLKVDSPTPLNISKQEREVTVKRIMEGFGQVDLFDVLAKIIKSMIIKDTFVRFMLQYHEEPEDFSEPNSPIGSSVSASDSSLSNSSMH